MRKLLLLCLFSAFSGTALAEDSWQNDVTWSMQDTGPADCNAAYAQLGVDACLGQGNRACVMEHAVQAAEEGKCQRAFRLTSMTQCHNGAAQARLLAAGFRAVCAYIKN
ncbi:hypothetical protein [Shinella zoogloeoides]|uniref:DUF3551 domain-containing protein n=1 Tax=Shinella zoogloeoides TaxID=352475 RepID=A0A6N8THU5_SHIZO|nr:hypothetical protein [Shinella zoogloeoides]MXO02867.1 hypothetical protein [Shinella zoogloeoides]UEX83110.1 hypothetical protein K8M09_07525 [Shinella zoogloeoides]